MSAHKNVFQTSDFITYTVMFLAFILEILFPTDLQINHNLLIVFGILLIVLSWMIIIIAKYQFRKHNQKSGPNNETTKIIKTGLFAYSRNPIYLGVIFLAPAVGFAINSIWIIYAIVPIFFLIQYILIIPEERYLADKFNDEYKNYCSSVRRWL